MIVGVSEDNALSLILYAYCSQRIFCIWLLLWLLFASFNVNGSARIDLLVRECTYELLVWYLEECLVV